MAVKKTNNYNFNKPDKGTRSWDQLLNDNFDSVDGELKRQKDEDSSLNSRIDNIVAQSGTDNTEVVDARTSGLSDKVYTVLDGRLDEMDKYQQNHSTYASGKDDNGIYTVVEYKDNGGVLFLKSTASNPDAVGNYQTVTLEHYDTDGTTVIKTVVYTLSYDLDGKIISKVVS